MIKQKNKIRPNNLKKKYIINSKINQKISKIVVFPGFVKLQPCCPLCLCPFVGPYYCPWPWPPAVETWHKFGCGPSR